MNKTDVYLMLFYLLELRRTHNAAQAALIVKPTEGVGFTFRAVAISGTRIHETAAANALYQEMSTNQAKGTVLILTYRPTEHCLGLMWIRFVSTVFFLDEGEVRQIDRADNPPPTGLQSLDVGHLPNNPPNLQVWFTESGRKSAGKMWNSFQEQVAQHNNRIQRADPLATLATLPFLQHLPLGPSSYPCSSVFRDGLFIKLALALVGCSWSIGSLGSNDTPREGEMRVNSLPLGNNIGAILVNSSNKIIAWSVNVASISSTCHAESALIRTFLCHGGQLPRGCRLYTTLEPCHMCAGLIAKCCESWTVIYAQKDPAINNNALARGTRTTTQQPALNAGREVEQAWTNYLSTNTQKANTLNFLRDPSTRRVFSRFQLVPARIEQALYSLGSQFGSQNISLRPTSTNLVGRLNLDLPGGALPNRPPMGIRPAESNRRFDSLDLAHPSMTQRVPEPMYQTGGFAQEAALTTQAVQFMTNLLNHGLIQFPD